MNEGRRAKLSTDSADRGFRPRAEPQSWTKDRKHKVTAARSEQTGESTRAVHRGRAVAMSRPPPPYPGANIAPGASSARRSQAASRSAGAGAVSSASVAQAISASDTSHAFRPNPIDSILAEQGLERYHLDPPSWRAPWIVRPAQLPEQADKSISSAVSVGLGPNKSLIRLAGAPAPVAGSGGATPGSLTTGVTGSVSTAANGNGGDRLAGCTAWPVFYPPHDGMDEDRLTEQVVKQGFAAKSVVQVSSAANGAPRARN